MSISMMYCYKSKEGDVSLLNGNTATYRVAQILLIKLHYLHFNTLRVNSYREIVKADILFLGYLRWLSRFSGF